VVIAVNEADNKFKNTLKTIKNPKVLEIGTLQWVNNVSTHHGAWLPEGSIHVKSDISPGRDVDIVSDVHDLKEFEDSSFDAFMAMSVWEHLRKPWIAADAAWRVLKPGGILFVATHFVFPVHGYPSDYTRWTDKGLEELFDSPKWHSQKSALSFPCKIIPPKEVKVWSSTAHAYLNVCIFAVKS